MSLTFAPPSPDPGADRPLDDPRRGGPTLTDTVDVNPRPASAMVTSAGRDRPLDLVRFGCLLVVVVLHAMMSGVQLGPGGEVVPTVALSTTAGFAIASWGFQIMPLFFVIGGFASLQQWRRTAARGGTWADYLRVRVRRLVAPATVLVLGAGTGLAIAGELGVPTALLTEAGLRVGQPLWFLAVYVGLTALVPLMVRFHDRSPRRIVLLFGSAVAVVDGLVALTGVGALGYLNFLFVWPLIQQGGFVFADLSRRTVRPVVLIGVGVVALGLLGWLVSVGVYSPNMLTNLNPPTGALVLLGIVHLCVLRLVHAQLTRFVDRVSSGGGRITVDRAVEWANRYGMHVYLWHMIVVIAVIGVQGGFAGVLIGEGSGFGAWLSAVVMPTIETPWWWVTRGIWVAAVLGLTALLAAGLERVDVPPEARLAQWGRVVTRWAQVRRWARTRLWVGSERARALMTVGFAIAGIAIALLVGLAPFVWTLIAGGALVVSLVLAAGLAAGLGACAGDRD